MNSVQSNGRDGKPDWLIHFLFGIVVFYVIGAMGLANGAQLETCKFVSLVATVIISVLYEAFDDKWDALLSVGGALLAMLSTRIL